MGLLVSWLVRYCHLIFVFIPFLLVPDVRPDHRLLQSHCTDTISPGPKFESHYILPPTVSLIDLNRRLPFQSPYRMRHTVLRRYADAHVDVIRHHIALPPVLRRAFDIAPSASPLFLYVLLRTLT